MDVVERVHEEVGIDLIAQIFQLLLQILTLQLLQPLAVVAAAEVALDAEVGAKHQDEHNDGQDVALADDGRWRIALAHLGKRSVEWWTLTIHSPWRLVEVRLLMSVRLFHRRLVSHGLVFHRPLEVRPAVALEKHECRDDDGHDGNIDDALPLMHQ